MFWSLFYYKLRNLFVIFIGELLFNRNFLYILFFRFFNGLLLNLSGLIEVWIKQWFDFYKLTSKRLQLLKGWNQFCFFFLPLLQFHELILSSYIKDSLRDLELFRVKVHVMVNSTFHIIKAIIKERSPFSSFLDIWDFLDFH